MNLGDAGDGMVPLDTKPKLEQPSTSFVDENLIEKNVYKVFRNRQHMDKVVLLVNKTSNLDMKSKS